MNKFNYYISDSDKKIDSSSGIWNKPVPVDRKNNKSDKISYGIFFRSAENFIAENINSIPLKIDCSDDINIHLEKHGRFYHPARIEIENSGIHHQFVLNTAIDDTGIMCMNYEIESLQTLSKKDFNHIPEVYFSSEFVFDENKFSMFFGNWFDNYCEFHITYHGNSQKIIVWDSDNYFLTRDEEIDLYRQCSKILTDYYDERSFSQISPWHHAAGDFVIKKEKDLVVKLITVRQYSPFTEAEDPDEIDFMRGLIYYFLNLSIRMRIDRVDGVKDIVWADDHCVDGLIKGFLESIEVKKPFFKGSSSLKDCFLSFTEDLKFSELYDFAEDMVESYNQNSPEIPIIKTKLKKHIEKICTFF